MGESKPGRKKLPVKNKKPILIQCGKHFINPIDIRCITKVRRDLYVVKFFSDPNPQYPCWVKSHEIEQLLQHFNIIVSEEGDTDEEEE